MPILLVAFIVTSILWTALSFWLSARQTACVRRHRDTVPADFAATVSLEDHRKAADYTVANERLANVRALIDLAVSWRGYWEDTIYCMARWPRSWRHRSASVWPS